MTKTVISLGLLLPNFALAANGVPVAPTNPIFAPKLQPIYVNPKVFSNSQFLSFSPDVKAVGPVFGEGNLQKYYALIFRHIIQQADLKIHDEPLWGYQAGTNDNFSYYTFLVLALAIVQHESRGIHLRTASGDQCFQKANELGEFWRTVVAVLQPIYRDPLRPLVPDCRYLQNAAAVDQMLFYAPSGDLGIMQMNARYHPAAMDPTILMNVYRSIDAGIDFVWSGYEKSRDQLLSPKFHCIQPSDPFESRFSKSAWLSKPAIWASLAVASWSHTYNGQPLCSASTKNAEFFNDLMSIVRDDSSVWHKYLPEGTVERAALNEIVADFRAAFSKKPMPEQHAALDEILDSSGTTYGTWRMPKRTLIGPTHSLLPGQISIYYAPVTAPQYACGYLKSDGYGTARVHVVSSFTDQNHFQWGEIELPKYVSFAHIGAVEMLKLRKGVYASRVHNIPNLSVGTRSGLIRRNVNGKSPILDLITTKTGKDGRLWDEMIDDGTIVYGIASNFEPFYQQAAPSTTCSSHYFFVPMADLKKLPPNYQNGKKYLAVVVGKGELDPMTLPNSLSMASSVSLLPGRLVTVDGSTINGQGEKWYKILVDQSDSTTLWAPASRIQNWLQIKPGSGG